jgi:hypothetical protein
VPCNDKLYSIEFQQSCPDYADAYAAFNAADAAHSLACDLSPLGESLEVVQSILA